MTGPHTSHGIVQRLANCLHRQLDAFEAALHDLDAMGPETTEATPDLGARQEHHCKRVQQLEEELRLLMPEWKAAQPPPTDAERESVSDLAAKAQALADELQQRYKTRHIQARDAAKGLQRAMDDLRASRAPLRYHPNPESAAQRVDHKA